MSIITLPIAPNSGYFGLAKYPPGGTHGPRVQRGLQFVYLLEGEAEISVDDHLQRLLPGSMALLLPGRREHFQFHRTRHSVHSWCQLDFEQVPERFNQPFTKVAPQLPINTEIEQLMELGLSFSASGHIDTNVAAIKLGEALLHYYLALDAQPAAQRTQPMARVVRKACQHIAEHFEEPLNLQNIADSANCSVNHLINAFKRQFGLTPARYLWNTRIDRGARLLKQTDIPVVAIAEQCGFVSPFHFSRLFKESRQLSPRAFRAQYRQQVDD